MDQLFWPGMNDMFLLFNNFSFFALVHPNSSKLSVGCHEVSDMWPRFEPDARFYLEAFSIFHLLITYNRILNPEFRDLNVSVQFLTLYLMSPMTFGNGHFVSVLSGNTDFSLGRIFSIRQRYNLLCSCRV